MTYAQSDKKFAHFYTVAKRDWKVVNGVVYKYQLFITRNIHLYDYDVCVYVANKTQARKIAEEHNAKAWNF